jgi:hypothetical protein
MKTINIILGVLLVLLIGCSNKIIDEGPIEREISELEDSQHVGDIVYKGCADEDEQVFDMEEKGPIECCEGLELKRCEGECTPSILGVCKRV